MRKTLKILLLVALVTLSTWAAVLWHWDRTKRDMSVNDIVIYLLALPAVVIALSFWLRWAWQAAAARAAASAAGPGSSAAAKSVQTDADDASRHATLKLLSAHMCTPTGQTPADMLAAAKEGKPRPSPFDELRSDDGMPVMCASIPELDPDAASQLAEAAMPAVRQQQPPWASASVAPHVWRALAALEVPLCGVLADLNRWPNALGMATHDPGEASPAPHTQVLVRVLVAWPAPWSDFEHAVAMAWLRLRVTREGTTRIPASRFVFDATARTGEELWIEADRLMGAMAREGRNDVVVLAACDSDISEAAVALLHEHRSLFSVDRHPKALMPGEGSAALALAPLQAPPAPDDDKPIVQVHRPSVQRRDKSIEADGRVVSDCLKRTVEQALRAARLDAPAVGMPVCDADQHTPRATGLFDTTLDLLPHRTPTDDMRLLGVGTGHTGAASPLIAVAAAAEEAHGTDQPVIALTLGDAFVRMAMVVRTMPTPLETTSSS